MGKHRAGKHAPPQGQAGQAARRRLRAERMRRAFPGGVWGAVFRSLAFALAIGFADSVDVSLGARLLLIWFGALLPLGVIGWSGTRAASFLGERRARRRLRPRPRVTYLLLALGWALTGGVCALLAWAAGARPAGEDWIATGLVWGVIFSACGTLMMIGRAVSAGTAVRPGRLVRRSSGWLHGSSVPLAGPGVPVDRMVADAAGGPSADRDRAAALAELGQCLELLLRRREQEESPELL